jgi:hypothetical protein
MGENVRSDGISAVTWTVLVLRVSREDVVEWHDY